MKEVYEHISTLEDRIAIKLDISEFEETFEHKFKLYEKQQNIALKLISDKMKMIEKRYTEATES